MTDLQIIKLIEEEIEYNIHMIECARMWGINNKVAIEYANKNAVLHHILYKITKQIDDELDQQNKYYKEVNNENIE